MSDKIIEKSIKQEYKYGFHTSIDQDTFPPGLNREIICKLSEIKCFSVFGQRQTPLLEVQTKSCHYQKIKEQQRL